MSKSKLFFAAALCLAGGIGAAHARSPEVQWSVTIGTPIHVQPAVRYGPPVVHYGPPAVSYSQPVPVYVQPRGYGYGPVTRWDRDGDGVPNRRDRVYNPRWDRDGDGIPNRRDRHYGNHRDEVRGGWHHAGDRRDDRGRRGD